MMHTKIFKMMLVLLLPAALMAQTDRVFTVTGTALKSVNPTQVVITAGVEVESKSAETAYKNMRDQMATAVKYLKEQKNVKSYETDLVRMSKSYQSGGPSGFRASQTMKITLTKIEFYDELMLKLFELGFNNISNVEFVVENMPELKRQVQLEAIQSAKEKAKAFADELGVELMSVHSFSEQNFYRGPASVANYKMADEMPASAPSIAPNQVDIMMTVIVSFTFKPNISFK